MPRERSHETLVVVPCRAGEAGSADMRYLDAPDRGIIDRLFGAIGLALKGLEGVAIRLGGVRPAAELDP